MSRPDRGQEDRRQAWRRGRSSETKAAWWLRLKGYRILARDFRVPVGEIDLIAKRGRALAFVEVKARASQAAAAQAITARQRLRIERAALAYLQRHPGLARLQPRFDAVLVEPGRLPRHLPDAWRPDR